LKETGEEPPFQRGMRAFEEKPDLLPFEEAKLYGHNATHALAAYVGAVRGVQRIADLPGVAGILPFLAAAAFIEESGAALIGKARRRGFPSSRRTATAPTPTTCWRA